MTNKKIVGLVFILALVSGLVTTFWRSGSIRQTMQAITGGGFGYNPDSSVTVMTDTAQPLPAKLDMGTAPMMTDQTAEIKMMPPAYGGGSSVAPSILNRAYQRYASFGVVVKDVNAYTANLRTYITGLGGIITNSSMGQSPDYSYAFITARVPEDKLDTAMVKVTEGVTKIMNQNLSSTDVTAYQQDIKTQVTAVKKQIAQQQLLLGRATSEYERQRIQLEIESLQNQLANYESQLTASQEQVQYASLDITAASNTKYFDGQPVGVWGEIKSNFSSFGRIFSSAFKLAVWIGAYALVWLPVLLVIRWVFGRK